MHEDMRIRFVITLTHFIHKHPVCFRNSLEMLRDEFFFRRPVGEHRLFAAVHHPGVKRHLVITAVLHHDLVIPEQAGHIELLAQLKNPIDHTFRIWTTINIVSQRNDAIIVRWLDKLQKRIQGGETSMYVTDGQRSQSLPLLLVQVVSRCWLRPGSSGDGKLVKAKINTARVGDIDLIAVRRQCSVFLIDFVNDDVA